MNLISFVYVKFMCNRSHKSVLSPNPIYRVRVSQRVRATSHAADATLHEYPCIRR